jgi:hypothetical protein
MVLQISLLEECGMLDRALEEMHKMESKIVSVIFPCLKEKIELLYNMLSS